MGDETKPGTPKWILIATAVASLAAALLILVTRYYEVRKARAEAARAESAQAGSPAPAREAPPPNLPDSVTSKPSNPKPADPPQAPPRRFGQVRQFPGHAGRVWSLAVSRDGRLAVTGGEDKTARVWDITAGTGVKTFTRHTGVVRSVAFSPDCTHVLSGSWDGTARVWSAATGHEIQCFRGHRAELAGVAFDNSGEHALTCGSDGQILMWRVDTGEIVRRFEGHEGQVWSLAVSPDADVLCSAGLAQPGQKPPATNFLRVWDFGRGRPRYTLVCQPEGVHSVTVSPDGRVAVGGSSQGRAIAWDLKTRSELARFPGHAVQFGADRKLLAVGNNDGSVAVWDATTWKEVCSSKGHTQVVQGVAFCLDNTHLMSASWDGTVRLWRLPE